MGGGEGRQKKMNELQADMLCERKQRGEREPENEEQCLAGIDASLHHECKPSCRRG